MKFYVQVWQPKGTSPEMRAELASFDEAVDWLKAGRAENPARLPRLVSYSVDAAGEETLAAMGMHAG